VFFHVHQFGRVLFLFRYGKSPDGAHSGIVKALDPSVSVYLF
jgi:hypothetical protein